MASSRRPFRRCGTPRGCRPTSRTSVPPLPPPPSPPSPPPAPPPLPAIPPFDCPLEAPLSHPFALLVALAIGGVLAAIALWALLIGACGAQASAVEVGFERLAEEGRVKADGAEDGHHEPQAHLTVLTA